MKKITILTNSFVVENTSVQPVLQRQFSKGDLEPIYYSDSVSFKHKNTDEYIVPKTSFSEFLDGDNNSFDSLQSLKSFIDTNLFKQATGSGTPGGDLPPIIERNQTAEQLPVSSTNLYNISYNPLRPNKAITLVNNTTIVISNALDGDPGTIIFTRTTGTEVLTLTGDTSSIPKDVNGNIILPLGVGTIFQVGFKKFGNKILWSI